MALGSFPLAIKGMMASSPACMVDSPGVDSTVVLAVANLVLSEKIIQKFLNSERSHCGNPGLSGSGVGDIYTPWSPLPMRSLGVDFNTTDSFGYQNQQTLKQQIKK